MTRLVGRHLNLGLRQKSWSLLVLLVSLQFLSGHRWSPGISELFQVRMLVGASLTIFSWFLLRNAWLLKRSLAATALLILGLVCDSVPRVVFGGCPFPWMQCSDGGRYRGEPGF